MSENSRRVFTLPEKHHKRLRKGLEIVISVDCSFRVNSDTTKHLQKHKYVLDKILYKSVLERRGAKRAGKRKEKGKRKRPIQCIDSPVNFIISLANQKIELDYELFF